MKNESDKDGLWDIVSDGPLCKVRTLRPENASQEFLNKLPAVLEGKMIAPVSQLVQEAVKDDA